MGCLFLLAVIQKDRNTRKLEGQDRKEDRPKRRKTNHSPLIQKEKETTKHSKEEHRPKERKTLPQKHREKEKQGYRGGQTKGEDGPSHHPPPTQKETQRHTARRKTDQKGGRPATLFQVITVMVCLYFYLS